MFATMFATSLLSLSLSPLALSVMALTTCPSRSAQNSSSSALSSRSAFSSSSTFSSRVISSSSSGTTPASASWYTCSAFRSFLGPATLRRMMGMVMPISFRSAVYDAARSASDANSAAGSAEVSPARRAREAPRRAGAGAARRTRPSDTRARGPATALRRIVAVDMVEEVRRRVSR